MKNKITKRIMLIVLCVAMIIPEYAFGVDASAIPGALGTGKNIKKAPQVADITTLFDEVIEAAANLNIPSSVCIRNGLPLGGISSLTAGNDVLSKATPVLSEGEIDWQLRASAIEGYKNLGIAQVGSYLNVRDKASSNGKVIGKMMNYNICDILEKSSDGKWLKIESGSVTGWVSSEYITTGWQAEDLAKEHASLTIKIAVDTVNVRTGPSVNSLIWEQADQNAKYDVVRDLGEWIEIELDDATGFVSSDYVTIGYTLDTAVKWTDPVKSLRQRIVDYALQWVGGKYVWGGESLSKGVDCSGFTMKVYQHFGYSLTHYSGDQAHEGKKISRSELKQGDLVFYSKDGTINHVAIYIGNGQVVHARSTKRGICVTDMDYRTPVRFVSVLK